VASVARDPDTILRFTSTGKPSFCGSLDIRQKAAAGVSLTRGQAAAMGEDRGSRCRKLDRRDRIVAAGMGSATRLTKEGQGGAR